MLKFFSINCSFIFRDFVRIVFICIGWYIVSSGNGVLGNKNNVNYFAILTSRVEWLQPLFENKLKIRSFLGDFHLKIGAFYDSRSRFGQMTDIKMPECRTF